MNDKHFNEVVCDRVAAIQAVLSAKAKEYARGDRLSNFKRAGEIGRTIPERALVGMLLKHLVSVLDYVDTLESTGELDFTINFAEKIGDSINYLILLEALMIERKLQSMVGSIEKKSARK